MKHLLTGVAMAAALAIAAPVWAQNTPMTPTAPSKPAPAAKAPAKAPAAPKAAPAAMAKKPVKHAASKKSMSQGDSMTEQLNQQELQRIQGGNMSPPPAPGGAMPPPGGAMPPAGGGMGAPPPPK